MYSITRRILLEYTAFNTKKQNYSMKKISTFLQSKTSDHVTIYKIWMNKNGGQSNPVGVGGWKRMNTPLGTIQIKELCASYLERARLRSIQNAT